MTSISSVSHAPPPAKTAPPAPPPARADNDCDNDGGRDDVRAAAPPGMGLKVDTRV